MKVTWKKTEAAGIAKVVLGLTLNSSETVLEFGPEVSTFSFILGTSGVAKVRIETFNSRNEVLTSEVYTINAVAPEASASGPGAAKRTSGHKKPKKKKG